MKKLLLIVFLMSAVGANAATIGEIADRYAELEKSDLELKTAKNRAEAGAAGRSPIGAPSVIGSEKSGQSAKDTDNLTLNGVFGLGQDLRADISINNVGVVMKKGESALGWKVLEVGKYEVTVAKVNNKRGTTGKTIQLRLLGASEPPAPITDAGAVKVGEPIPPPSGRYLQGRQ